MIDLNNKKHIFSKPNRTSNPLRIFIWLLIVIGLLFVIRGFNTGKLISPFSPTHTPTRTLNSYALEGDTQFKAGNLEKAIAAYQNAVKVDPKNAELWAQLARIQVYSTTQITTDAAKRARLLEAFASIDSGLAVAPENSMLYAVKAFASDWYGNQSIAGADYQKYLNQGEQSAVQALQYDTTNDLAKAYYAELLVDQQKWTQAEQYINQALQKESDQMDVYRVAGFVQESLGNYTKAIEYYEKAISITPNMNLLYLSIGANYRKLADLSQNKALINENYNKALDMFAKAVKINNQQGVNDPIPLISIANTYVQMGEFFSAARNMVKAVQFSPTDPSVYGRLGIVYYKSRNYEGAIPALKCYVSGCTAAESCYVRNGGQDCDPNNIPNIPIPGQALSQNSVAYYFTYASDLAGLHQPSNKYCDTAMPLFKQITAAFSQDPTIMSIVSEGEGICESYGYK
ncbi:MAG: tetratricopeptide repeat protein [Anaerolineaceae bacterium]